MPHCAICSPEWRFLCHVITSCKGAITTNQIKSNVCFRRGRKTGKTSFFFFRRSVFSTNLCFQDDQQGLAYRIRPSFHQCLSTRHCLQNGPEIYKREMTHLGRWFSLRFRCSCGRESKDEVRRKFTPDAYRVFAFLGKLKIKKTKPI